MILSVFNDGIEWSLDFGPGSVTLIVEDLVQEMTISSQQFTLAAWSLLLSQRQQFLNNHLALVPVTPNQQGTHEMRDEMLSSVGAQEGLDTSGYQLSAYLDDVEFYWENISWMYTLFLDRALILLFHRQRLKTWRWEVQQKTPFCSLKRKTKRTFLQQQQHQPLRDQHNTLLC